MCDGDGRQCGHYTNDLRIFVEYIYVILWTHVLLGIGRIHKKTWLSK